MTWDHRAQFLPFFPIISSIEKLQSTFWLQTDFRAFFAWWDVDKRRCGVLKITIAKGRKSTLRCIFLTMQNAELDSFQYSSKRRSITFKTFASWANVLHWWTAKSFWRYHLVFGPLRGSDPAPEHALFYVLRQKYLPAEGEVTIWLL